MLNIFKKKNGKEKEKAEPKQVLEEKAKTEAEVEEKKSVGIELKGDHFSFQAMQGPHITEKASALNSLNQYIFKVFTDANKIQIRKAIENLYNVKVESVKILNMPGKQRRLGRIEGRKPGFKKAIVKLEKDYKIDLIPK